MSCTAASRSTQHVTDVTGWNFLHDPGQIDYFLFIFFNIYLFLYQIFIAALSHPQHGHYVISSWTSSVLLAVGDPFN